LVRHRVVAFTMALAAVTYLDRVCIAVLAPKISAEPSLSRIEMGYIFSAFAVAYAAFGCRPPGGPTVTAPARC